MKRYLGTVLFVIAVVSIVVNAQQPLQRDSPTVNDLKLQIADCTINATTEAKYEAKLEARIKQLEKELADLKAVTP